MAAVSFSILLILVVAAFKFFQPDNYLFENWPQIKSIDFLESEYDFIVVGSGAAGMFLECFDEITNKTHFFYRVGAVVASRLSEVEGWNVLLLEAGYLPHISTDIPLLKTSDRGNEWDWNYVTTPQKHSFQGKTHYVNCFHMFIKIFKISI